MSKSTEQERIRASLAALEDERLLIEHTIDVLQRLSKSREDESCEADIPFVLWDQPSKWIN